MRCASVAANSTRSLPVRCQLYRLFSGIYTGISQTALGVQILHALVISGLSDITLLLAHRTSLFIVPSNCQGATSCPPKRSFPLVSFWFGLAYRTLITPLQYNHQTLVSKINSAIRVSLSPSMLYGILVRSFQTRASLFNQLCGSPCAPPWCASSRLFSRKSQSALSCGMRRTR